MPYEHCLDLECRPHPDRCSCRSLYSLSRRLKELLNETDGNLGAHLRKLEDSGYVDLDKQFENRRPVSWYALSKGGRAALKKHLQALEVLISQSFV